MCRDFQEPLMVHVPQHEIREKDACLNPSNRGTSEKRPTMCNAVIDRQNNHIFLQKLSFILTRITRNYGARSHLYRETWGM